jgi:hypothetical protein
VRFVLPEHSSCLIETSVTMAAIERIRGFHSEEMLDHSIGSLDMRLLPNGFSHFLVDPTIRLFP